MKKYEGCPGVSLTPSAGGILGFLSSSIGRIPLKPPQTSPVATCCQAFSRMVFLRMSSPLGIMLGLTLAIALAAAVVAVGAVVAPHDASEQSSN